VPVQNWETGYFDDDSADGQGQALCMEAHHARLCNSFSDQQLVPAPRKDLTARTR
jgi:hypothetical protein